MNLSGKFLELNGRLTEDEKANFKLVLGLAAGSLSPGFEKALSPQNSIAFETVADTLARLQPYSARISANGVAYRGRPSLITDQLLAQLQDEARTLRQSAHRFEDHFLGCGAPVANNLAVSSALCDLVRKCAGDVKPTGVASFIYYDEEGQGIDPHIDTDIFALNVIVMLEHKAKSEQRSSLVVFPVRSQPERLDLAPGEMVILFAGSVAHGRERIKFGEAVTILTLGFHPLGV